MADFGAFLAAHGLGVKRETVSQDQPEFCSKFAAIFGQKLPLILTHEITLDTDTMISAEVAKNALKTHSA